MSIFDQIFNVFSRRQETPSSLEHKIPETFRNRIVFWCNEVFGNNRSSYGADNYANTFWKQLRRFLQYRHGRANLTEVSYDSLKDTMTFLALCSGEEFLDVLEYIFRVDCFFHVALDENQLIEEINEFFRIDDLPYFLTDFIKETVREVCNEYPFHGREGDVTKTVSYPRVIMKESEHLHSQAIKPTLELLKQPEFRSANSEFLEALEDYRKGDLGDCLTKCGSAFESVLKVVIDKKGWPYKQTDTASTLIKTLINNTQLENYFEQTLMIVATLRNRLSKSHGAGTSPRDIPRHFARYTINITATSILLIADEVGMQ